MIPIRRFRSLCSWIFVVAAMATPGSGPLSIRAAFADLDSGSIELIPIRECPPSRYLSEVHAGYGRLISGWSGFSSLPGFGGALSMISSSRGRVDSRGRGGAACDDRLFFRLSLDFVPLKVPDGNYGLKEEMTKVGFAIMYKGVGRDEEYDKFWFPMVGGGLGLVFDRLSMETPSTGVVTGTHTLFELFGSAGLVGPQVFWAFRFNPEVKVHALKVPGTFLLNAEVTVGLTYWPRPDLIWRSNR